MWRGDSSDLVKAFDGHPHKDPTTLVSVAFPLLLAPHLVLVDKDPYLSLMFLDKDLVALLIPLLYTKILYIFAKLLGNSSSDDVGLFCWNFPHEYSTTNKDRVRRPKPGVLQKLLKQICILGCCLVY